MEAPPARATNPRHRGPLEGIGRSAHACDGNRTDLRINLAVRVDQPVAASLRENKKATGINFVYWNIAKFTTNGSDVSADKQKEIAAKIKDYLDGGYYVLLSWCWSRTWAEKMGL